MFTVILWFSVLTIAPSPRSKSQTNCSSGSASSSFMIGTTNFCVAMVILLPLDGGYVKLKLLNTKSLPTVAVPIEEESITNEYLITSLCMFVSSYTTIEHVPHNIASVLDKCHQTCMH